MPERHWYIPVEAARAIEDTDRNIGGYYNVNYDMLLNRYFDWQDRNDLFGDEPVSAAYGGQPLADMVGFTVPSLYTFYRDSNTANRYRMVSVDANVQDSTFSISDIIPHDGLKVRVIPTVGNTVPTGLSAFSYYYLVNTADGEFQLATSVAGEPIGLSGSIARRILPGN